MNVLTKDSLRIQAPAVFTDSNRMSDIYKQYSTEKVVDLLDAEGWSPVKAKQQGTGGEYSKHMLRFMHKNDIATGASLGKEVFQIVLINSHNGTSSYNLMAGIYRFVCSNGLVVGSDLFQYRVRHVGSTPRQVVNASMKLVHNIPAVMDKINAMKSVQLDMAKMEELAQKAYSLRWKKLQDDEEGVAFDPRQLLKVKRSEDNKQDLWSVFNTIQENMIQGRYIRDRFNIFRKIRKVTSINEDIRVNRNLWNIAESYTKN